MHPLRALGVYGVVVFAGGALLAPGLHWACQYGAARVPGWDALAQIPFHRIVNRSLLLLALLGLWPLLRSLRANSWTAVGLAGTGPRGRNLAVGLVLGFLTFACIAAPVLLAGARKLDFSHSLPWVLKCASSALGTAVAVACLEELLFRGAIFGALRRVYRWPAALVLSSAIYALVHFFEKPPQAAGITWTSGWVVLAQMFRGFVQLDHLVPGFFTLTFAGMILGLAYQRTGALYCPIGFHASWVFWLKIYGAMTDSQPGANVWFWGAGKLIDGWLALLVLGLVFVAAGCFFHPAKPVEQCRELNIKT